MQRSRLAALWRLGRTISLLALVLGLATPAAFAGSTSPGSLTLAVGTVAGWGYNQSGQVGNGNTTNQTHAVPVSGLNGVKGIAAGWNHSLAVLADGSVYAWGRNDAGQLGLGTTCTPFLCGVTTPMLVSGISGVIAVTGGDEYSLALKADGTVWAWGYNGSGQLGDGTTTDRNSPGPVSGLNGVIAIAAGGIHALALKSDGSLWAWGDNSFGQLGTGSLIGSTVPVRVSGLSGITAIAASGYHSLALKADGTVWAWGDNTYGELGNGTTTASAVPVAVSGLSGVRAIAAGEYHSLALKSDGTLWAWGNNTEGELGNGSTTNSSIPVRVASLTGVIAMAGGYFHTLAVKSDSTVWAWGDNNDGELGNGHTSTGIGSTTPIQVVGLSGAAAVAAGAGHSLAMGPPATTAPPSAPTGLTVGAVTFESVALSWTDTATNATGYVVERKAGSGSYAQVGSTLPASAAAFTDTTVAPFTTYSYRVKAVNQGGSSPYSNEVAVKTYSRNEDSSPNVTYTGIWKQRSDTHCSGDSCHYSSDPNGNASLTWTGTDVQVVMTTGPMMGKAYVVVDGALVVVDLYSPTLQYQQLVYAKTGLAIGSHTVKVSASGIKNPASSGTTVALDAFDTR